MHHVHLTSTMLCAWQQAVANYHVLAATVLHLHKKSEWINPNFSVHGQSNSIKLCFLKFIHSIIFLDLCVCVFFTAEEMAGQWFWCTMPCQLVKSYWLCGISSWPNLQDLNSPRRGLLKPLRWKHHASRKIFINLHNFVSPKTLNLGAALHL